MTCVAPSYWGSPEFLMVSIWHGGGRLLDVVSVTLLHNDQQWFKYANRVTQTLPGQRERDRGTFSI